MIKKIGLPVLVVVLVALGFFYNKFQATKKIASPTNNQGVESYSSENTEKIAEFSVTLTPTLTASPTKMEIDNNKKYQAILKTTEGDITIDLNAKDTPITANNFVILARKKFYDGTIFHRVINGFMIQGGDPNGNGTGGPGYKFNDEPFEGEYTRGTVAMANSGPNTNGSQFFIMHKDNPLPKNYVIFGKVATGIAVVDKIAEAPVKTNPMSGENSTPVTPVKVNSVVILEK